MSGHMGHTSGRLGDGLELVSPLEAAERRLLRADRFARCRSGEAVSAFRASWNRSCRPFWSGLAGSARTGMTPIRTSQHAQARQAAEPLERWISADLELTGTPRSSSAVAAGLLPLGARGHTQLPTPRTYSLTSRVTGSYFLGTNDIIVSTSRNRTPSLALTSGSLVADNSPSTRKNSCLASFA